MTDFISLDIGNVQIEIVNEYTVIITIDDWTVLLDNSKGERSIVGNFSYELD